MEGMCYGLPWERSVWLVHPASRSGEAVTRQKVKTCSPLSREARDGEQSKWGKSGPAGGRPWRKAGALQELLPAQTCHPGAPCSRWPSDVLHLTGGEPCRQCTLACCPVAALIMGHLPAGSLGRREELGPARTQDPIGARWRPGPAAQAARSPCWCCPSSRHATSTEQQRPLPWAFTVPAGASP